MNFDDDVKIKKISVGLPFHIGTIEMEADPCQKKAAWSIYIELVTRIAVESLEDDQGILREALTSLYNLFSITREVLKEAGPDVGATDSTVGGIAIRVLNDGLRPFVSKWHPLLQDWESKRLSNKSPREFENEWTQCMEMREELSGLRQNLWDYANALAEIAKV